MVQYLSRSLASRLLEGSRRGEFWGIRCLSCLLEMYDEVAGVTGGIERRECLYTERSVFRTFERTGISWANEKTVGRKPKAVYQGEENRFSFVYCLSLEQRKVRRKRQNLGNRRAASLRSFAAGLRLRSPGSAPFWPVHKFVFSPNKYADHLFAMPPSPPSLPVLLPVFP